MSDGCNHDCSSCGDNCASRQDSQSFIEKLNELSKVKKVIGVVSGKGGVGKSLVASMLAILMQRKGYNTAILDADITGPSIPKVFGLKEKAAGTELGVFPVRSLCGTEIMSVNLLLENETDPVVWRGPIIAGTVKQFWTDVVWNDVDFMFVDMPPGTGDVPLTVFQSLPVDAIVVVTSPQELVKMIVKKAVKMAELMKKPVIALVENMSYFKCPECNKTYDIFGKSRIDETAKELNIETVARIPIDPKFAELCDKGEIERFDADCLDNVAEKLEKLIK